MRDVWRPSRGSSTTSTNAERRSSREPAGSAIAASSSPPTVLTEVPKDARILHEEPFGRVAPILPFTDEAEMLTRANRLLPASTMAFFRESACGRAPLRLHRHIGEGAGPEKRQERPGRPDVTEVPAIRRPGAAS